MDALHDDWLNNRVALYIRREYMNSARIHAPGWICGQSFDIIGIKVQTCFSLRHLWLKLVRRTNSEYSC